MDIHVAAVARGVERYILIWDDASEHLVDRYIRRWEADSQLSFSPGNGMQLRQQLRADRKSSKPSRFRKGMK